MDAVRECHAASRALAIKKPGRAALGDDAFNHSIRYSVDFPQVAGLDQRAPCLHRWIEPVRHLYHGYARTGVGRIHDPPGFGQLRGQRLFKQQMLAGLQTLDRDGCMQMMGQANAHRVDLAIVKQLAPVFIDPHRRWQLGVAYVRGVCHGHDFEIFNGARGPQLLPAAIAHPDNAQAYGHWFPLNRSPGRPKCQTRRPLQS